MRAVNGKLIIQLEWPNEIMHEIGCEMDTLDLLTRETVCHMYTHN